MILQPAHGSSDRADNRRGMDFGGFDSSIVLILRGGIPRPVGNFLESLSQAILGGIMLVGKLGVRPFYVQRSRMLISRGAKGVPRKGV